MNPARDVHGLVRAEDVTASDGPGLEDEGDLVAEVVEDADVLVVVVARPQIKRDSGELRKGTKPCNKLGNGYRCEGQGKGEDRQEAG